MELSTGLYLDHVSTRPIIHPLHSVNVEAWPYRIIDPPQGSDNVEAWNERTKA
jgi:hypothetical protein